MATADLITQLKQDFDDVYAAGKSVGGGGGDYDQGYEDGKNSVVNVGRFCRTITFTNLNIFGTKEVVLNLDNALLLEETFRRSVTNYFGYVPNETVEHITINCPNKIISMYYFCAGEYDSIEQKLKHITLNVDTQNAKNWNYAFRYVKSVEIIDGNPFDFSSATSVTRMFDQCTALKEMRFAPNTLKLSITIPNSPSDVKLSSQSHFEKTVMFYQYCTNILDANKSPDPLDRGSDCQKTSQNFGVSKK